MSMMMEHDDADDPDDVAAHDDHYAPQFPNKHFKLQLWKNTKMSLWRMNGALKW